MNETTKLGIAGIAGFLLASGIALAIFFSGASGGALARSESDVRRLTLELSEVTAEISREAKALGINNVNFDSSNTTLANITAGLKAITDRLGSVNNQLSDANKAIAGYSIRIGILEDTIKGLKRQADTDILTIQRIAGRLLDADQQVSGSADSVQRVIDQIRESLK